MTKTAFLRSDELPGDAALGYLDVDGVRRTNVFHLPVRGTGDGGIYTTTADMASFWPALYAGAIVPLDVVAEMTRPRAVERGGAVPPLRPRLLAAPDVRRRVPGGVRHAASRSAASTTRRAT